MEVTQAAWRKAGRSTENESCGGNTGDCVEIAVITLE
jgi:hypothetical protein